MAKEGKRKMKTKKKKDPNRPKRAMSSFMFFANDKRADLREKFPELKITDIGRKLGGLWREVTPEEKLKYEARHSKDLERYKKEMESYVAPESESDSDSDNSSRRTRKKKPKKDPKKPKRAMSSFMFFANVKRADARAQWPELKVTEIGKKLAEWWRKLTPEEKKKYEDMQLADKERYKREMDSYEPTKEKAKEESSDSSSSGDGNSEDDT